MTEGGSAATAAPIRYIDNHCHLDPGADGDAQIEAARAAGVVRFVDVGTDAQRNRQTVASAARHPGVVFASVGLHPHDASDGIDGLADLVHEPGVVAVGECGLDYHYDHSPRDTQRAMFAAQIGLAHEHDLPLIIHTRDAWDDTFDILDSEGTPANTVFHCFTGGPTEAEQGLARGAHVSFSGIVTFKNAQDLRDALALCPIDRVMVETDSPYLAPEPLRGQRNTPANVALVAARMADVLGVDLDVLADQLWDTTVDFYRLPA